MNSEELKLAEGVLFKVFASSVLCEEMTWELRIYITNILVSFGGFSIEKK